MYVPSRYVGIQVFERQEVVEKVILRSGEFLRRCGRSRRRGLRLHLIGNYIPSLTSIMPWNDYSLTRSISM